MGHSGPPHAELLVRLFKNRFSISFPDMPMNTQTELEQLTAKLAHRQYAQERMVYVNEAYRAYLKNPDSLVNFPNLTQEDIVTVQTYKPVNSWDSKNPFAPFELTNNGSEIRRLTKRIEQLSEKQAKVEQTDGEPTIIPFVGGTIIYNYQLDRVQLQYDEIPDELTRTLLKSRGFKWSSTNGVWQRQLTANGKAAAAYVARLATEKTDMPMTQQGERVLPVAYPTDNL